MTKDKNVFIKNIYYMLSYAFTALHQLNYDDIEAEEFDHIHNLFAAILSKGIAQQIKRGLYWEYRSITEDMSALRGKLQMTGTIHNYLGQKRILTCEYDELSENNLLNQILKTTSFLLLRHTKVEGKYKSALRKAMMYFSDVDTIEPTSVSWSEIRFHRNNQTYRMLISLCQLIVEGMLHTTEQCEYKLASFLDEQRMCRLYEKFILEYYTQEHPELKASASRISWALDDNIGTMLPIMQSDITLYYKKKILIIDAKYYSRTMQTQYDTHTIHSNNLYQIFTYVKNKAADTTNDYCDVSGLLLYAQTNEAVQPDCSYSMSGNKISVKTLNLNCEFSEIARQMDQIVEKWVADDC